MGGDDAFEVMYMAKLKGLLAGHGIEVHYPNDRAGIDIGLHLFAENTATQARVWFQVEGQARIDTPRRTGGRFCRCIRPSRLRRLLVLTSRGGLSRRVRRVA